MKLRYTKVATLAAALITFMSLVGGANGAVIISNWNATESTLSFDITGSITDNNPGALQNHRIFIGQAGGNGQWASNSTYLNGSVLDNGGSTATVDIAWIFPDSGGGVNDTIQLESSSVDFGLGDSFNYSISYTGIVGDATLIDVNQVIVSWGRTDFNSAPEVAHQIGSFSAIPEPSSTLLLGFGALAVATHRRRIK